MLRCAKETKRADATWNGLKRSEILVAKDVAVALMDTQGAWDARMSKDGFIFKGNSDTGRSCLLFSLFRHVLNPLSLSGVFKKGLKHLGFFWHLRSKVQPSLAWQLFWRRVLFTTCLSLLIGCTWCILRCQQHSAIFKVIYWKADHLPGNPESG